MAVTATVYLSGQKVVLEAWERGMEVSILQCVISMQKVSMVCVNYDETTGWGPPDSNQI